MYDDFPAKNTICTLYVPIHVWFWPTLQICGRVRCIVTVLANPKHDLERGSVDLEPIEKSLLILLPTYLPTYLLLFL